MYYGLFQDQVVVGGRWSWQCYSPRHNFIGSIPNNINMPLLWAIINKAFTLLNSGLIRKHSVQFLGSCIWFVILALRIVIIWILRMLSNHLLRKFRKVKA